MWLSLPAYTMTEIRYQSRLDIETSTLAKVLEHPVIPPLTGATVARIQVRACRACLLSLLTQM
ncbi:hypothetical protein GGF41_005009 [Coemansia sp. RSA 2531]|nr:hypothetical protein GGF41_005009 [Coemansia sp. RSA 2531]